MYCNAHVNFKQPSTERLDVFKLGVQLSVVASFLRTTTPCTDDRRNANRLRAGTARKSGASWRTWTRCGQRRGPHVRLGH